MHGPFPSLPSIFFWDSLGSAEAALGPSRSAPSKMIRRLLRAGVRHSPSDIDASDRAMERAISLMCPANPAGRASTTTKVRQVVLAEGNSLFGTINLFVASQHAAFSA